MSDLTEIKDLLTTLISKQTNLGAMLTAVEKQGQRNVDAYKTIANDILEINQNIKVIAARLEVVEQDSKVNTTHVRFIRKAITKLEELSVDSRDMLETLHDRFIDESSNTRKKMKTLEDEIGEIADERASAGQ